MIIIVIMMTKTATKSRPTYRVVFSEFNQSFGIGRWDGKGWFQFGFTTEAEAIAWWEARNEVAR